LNKHASSLQLCEFLAAEGTECTAGSSHIYFVTSSCDKFVCDTLDVVLVCEQVVTAVVLCILLILKLFAGKHKNLPPGPRGFPVIGSLHLLGKHPHRDLAQLAKTYGPVMSLWIGAKLTVVASSPAAAEEILRTQRPNFSSRPKTHYGEVLLPGGMILCLSLPPLQSSFNL